jgi:hypothetical protein
MQYQLPSSSQLHPPRTLLCVMTEPPRRSTRIRRAPVPRDQEISLAPATRRRRDRLTTSRTADTNQAIRSSANPQEGTELSKSTLTRNDRHHPHLSLD